MIRALFLVVVLLSFVGCQSKTEVKSDKPGDKTPRKGSAPSAASADPLPDRQEESAKIDVREADLAPAPKVQPSKDEKAQDRKKKEELVTSANAPNPGEGILAWSDEGRISTANYERYLARVPAFQRREYGSIEKKMELLKNLIKFETLARLAIAEGLDKDPDVLLALQTEMVKKLLQMKFGAQAVVDVSEEQIKLRYEKDYAQYHKPARARASHLLISDRKMAEEVYAQIQEAVAKAGANPRKVFREFVRKYSEDKKTSKRGGDLLFFSREEVDRGEKKIDKAVVEAAFAMETTGQVSAPVKGASGYHLVMLTNKRDAVDRSMAEVHDAVADTLRREILEKKRREFMENVVNFDLWHFETRVLQQIKVEGDPNSHDVKDRVDSIRKK
jgi:peptidyl-prolyl cis-trans isomerase C